jgi:hypothetical protein
MRDPLTRGQRRDVERTIRALSRIASALERIANALETLAATAEQSYDDDDTTTQP